MSTKGPLLRLASVHLLAEMADDADRAGMTALADAVDTELAARAAEPALTDRPTVPEAVPTDPTAFYETEGLASRPTALRPDVTQRMVARESAPTAEDAMRALAAGLPLDPEVLREMPPSQVRLLKARLEVALSVIERAMGEEPQMRLSPRETGEMEIV